MKRLRSAGKQVAAGPQRAAAQRKEDDEMATTERGQFKFTVKDGATADVFRLEAEPAGEILESLDGSSIGFDLRPGTTKEQAEDIAAHMNRRIAAISLIRFTRGQ